MLLLLVLSSATAVQLPQAPSCSTRGATRGAFLRSALAAVSVCGGARQAIAQDVADIPASGLVFKDTIKIEGFTDPKVSGVKLYVADFQRPITEKLQKDFFNDPTQASVTCARTGPVKLLEAVEPNGEGEEVFSQSKSLFFKSVKVRRVYDKEANTIVYVSYSVRLSKSEDDNKSRFKSAMCTVPLG